MKINVLNASYEFPNTSEGIEQGFQTINDVIHENVNVFQYLVVDGTEVYEDHFEFVETRKETVETIDVVALPIRKFLDASLVELLEYLDRAVPETLKLAESFYQGPSQDTWALLTDLLEGLQWVAQVVDNVNQAPQQYRYSNAGSIVAVAGQLADFYKELEAALENQDLVLIGDLLKYEIVERLQELRGEVQVTIDNEVVRDDLS